MGHRLADTLVKNLNGEFDVELELNAQFAALVDTEVIDAEDVTEEPTETA